MVSKVIEFHGNFLSSEEKTLHPNEGSEDDADSEIEIICRTTTPTFKSKVDRGSGGSSSSGIGCRTDTENNKHDDTGSMSIKSLPMEDSKIKKKESIIRFADSVNLEDGNHNSNTSPTKDSTSFNLKVNSSSAKRQSTLTPAESYCEAYEMAEHRTPLGFDMSNRVS